MSRLVTLPNIAWRIQDFSATNKFSSPTVTFMGTDWKLTALYLPNTHIETSSVIHLLLKRTSPALKPQEPGVQFLIETSFIINDGSPIMRTDTCVNLCYEKFCLWSKSVSDIRKYSNTFSVKTAITFLVSIKLKGSTVPFDITELVERHSSKPPSWATCLSVDFGKILFSEEHSDVILKCDDKSFYAHRAILSARSDVFAAMFRNYMKENREGVVHITDMKPPILKSFLSYLYTGDVPEWSVDSAREIHAAADKYQVDCLRIKCALFVAENYGEKKESNSNETEEKRNEESDKSPPAEKKSVKEKLLRKLFLTLEWKTLAEEYPELASEMVRPLMSQGEL